MNTEGEVQVSEQTPSGDKPPRMMSRKTSLIPVTLIVVGLITVIGSCMVLNHLVANAWDSDPLHWEIATNTVLVGTLLVTVGLLAGAFDQNVDPLLRLGMILGATVMVSLVIYEALQLMSTFQLG